LLALELNGPAKQLMSPPIATEKGALRRKPMATGQLGYDLPIGRVIHKTELRQFALFSFEDGCHNQQSDQPVGDLRFGAPSRSRALPLGFLQAGDGQPKQFPQTTVGSGAFWHFWPSVALWSFLFLEKT